MLNLFIGTTFKLLNPESMLQCHPGEKFGASVCAIALLAHSNDGAMLTPLPASAHHELRDYTPTVIMHGLLDGVWLEF